MTASRGISEVSINNASGALISGVARRPVSRRSRSSSSALTVSTDTSRPRPRSSSQRRRARTSARISVPGYSLRTLAADLPPIDLLHIDIQGDEFDVLAAAPEVLTARVRRMCIGTHGREIEGRLLELLPDLGFRLRQERACVYGLGGRRPTLIEDGFQHWVRE